MRKYAFLSAWVLCFSFLWCPALAADPVGGYVAPKLLYGYTVMDKLKGTTWATDRSGNPFVLGEGSSRESDSIWGGGLAVGYDFSKRFKLPVRAELEYALFSQAEDSFSEAISPDYLASGFTAATHFRQTLDIQTLFLNAYWDIKTGTPFTPYLGGGIGAAFIRSKGSVKLTAEFMGSSMSGEVSDTRRTTNFAWNLDAGVGWDITDNLTLDLGYRFASLGEVKNKLSRGGLDIFETKTQNLYMHQLMLGLRVTF